MDMATMNKWRLEEKQLKFLTIRLLKHNGNTYSGIKKAYRLWANRVGLHCIRSRGDNDTMPFLKGFFNYLVDVRQEMITIPYNWNKHIEDASPDNMWAFALPRKFDEEGYVIHGEYDIQCDRYYLMQTLALASEIGLMRIDKIPDYPRSARFRNK